MNKTYAVYILTNYNETTFYIGITGNLQKRIWEHKNKVVEGLLKNIMLINWFTMNLLKMLNLH